MVDNAKIVKERRDRLLVHNVDSSAFDRWPDTDCDPPGAVQIAPGDHHISALASKATRDGKAHAGRASHDADPLSPELF
jgi:hypothetical protein